MPNPEPLKPWVLQIRKDGPHAGYVEVDRFASQVEASRAGERLAVGYRVCYDRVPVGVAEDESRN
ncbi:MAG: hypothetical protein V1790_17660 [Planctomycetota bacterium]